MADIVDFGFASCHRTTFGHFLSKGVWDKSYMWKVMKDIVLTAIQKTAKQTETSIYLGISILYASQ